MCATSLQSCLTLCDPMLYPTRLLCPWGFSRQEYWNGLPCPPPGHLPDPGIEPRFPALAGEFFTTSATQEALIPAYQGLINDSDYYCWEDLQCKPFMDPWSSVGGRCEDIVFSVTAGFQVRWGLPYSDFAKASFGEWRGILCYKEQHLKTNLSVSHSELILRCSPFSLSASLSAKRSWGNSWNDSCIWSPNAFLERILL